MTKKEELISRINDRKTHRAQEINEIPMYLLRRRYKEKLGDDEKLREFFSEHNEFFQKYNDSIVMQHIVRFIFSHMMLRVFKNQFHLGRQPKGFLDSVTDYIMYATSYCAWPLEIDEATDNQVIGYFDVCPAQCENNLPMCLAVTSLEPRLSKKSFFGATVTYTERIPEGAPRCKVVFNRRND